MDGETQRVIVHLRQKERYNFDVDWGLPNVTGVLDEPPPAGKGEGPNASRLLAAAVAHCLSSSLLFCLEKSRARCDGIETSAVAEIKRNERGRWRLSRITVTLGPKVPEEFIPNLKRCQQVFEDYCTVTESVRKGIEVDVRWAPQ
jgi:organic hydroperoxide reductase OsmC/OhrA